jgi:hypothetical protein
VCVEPEAICHAAPARFTAADAAEMAAAGLPLPRYAALEGAKWIFFSGLWIAVGALIFARRSDEVIALVAAFFLTTFPSLWDRLGVALVRAYPAVALPVQGFSFLISLSTLLFVALFPNGRFVPRWSRWVAVLWFLVGLVPRQSFGANGESVLLAVNVAGMSTLVVAQVIRYRRYSSPQERQRTRWVVFGFCLSIAFIALMIGLALAGVWIDSGDGPWAGLVSEGAYQLVVALIPLSIGLAILRARLWDIDVIIRRTLIYSALTALLAVAYLGSVLVLQAAFQALTGEGRNELVTVLSTLAIAALFVPLRGRVQAAIDRRFYRKKFDAARTLAEFAATARAETDLETLATQVVTIVQNTLQPEHVGLWLKPTASRRSISPSQDMR